MHARGREGLGRLISMAEPSRDIPSNRQPRPFVALGFPSTHAALDAEALLLDLGIEVVPMPAPAVLGKMCGIALRLDPRDEQAALNYLERSGIEVAARADITDV